MSLLVTQGTITQDIQDRVIANRNLLVQKRIAKTNDETRFYYKTYLMRKAHFLLTGKELPNNNNLFIAFPDDIYRPTINKLYPNMRFLDYINNNLFPQRVLPVVNTPVVNTPPVQV